MHVGEIIPQALCTRYGLAIGAYSAWFVRVLIWVVGIVSWPISKVLDYLLGSEHGVRSPDPSRKQHVLLPAFRPDMGGLAAMLGAPLAICSSQKGRAVYRASPVQDGHPGASGQLCSC